MGRRTTWPVAVPVCLPFILKYQECFSSTLKSVLV